MYCRSRNLIRETTTTKEYVADFIYENLDVTTITNYQVIKDHFTNFIINREYENFLTDQGNHSISYLKFKLRNTNNEENWVHLFSITIETDPVTGTTYSYYFREDYNDSFPGSFNNFINNNTNLENFYINIEMETKFYLQLNFNIEEEIEEETVPVEDVFTEDNCLVCIDNKPNILFLPCNHLVVCNKCENSGKFKYCIKCRKQIFRKIRINKEKNCVDKCVGDDEKKYVDKYVGEDEKKYVNTGVLSKEDEEKLYKKKITLKFVPCVINETLKNQTREMKILKEKIDKIRIKKNF